MFTTTDKPIAPQSTANFISYSDLSGHNLVQPVMPAGECLLSRNYHTLVGLWPFCVECGCRPYRLRPASSIGCTIQAFGCEILTAVKLQRSSLRSLDIYLALCMDRHESKELSPRTIYLLEEDDFG